MTLSDSGETFGISRLSGLKQAVAIADLVSKGETVQSIVGKLNGDEQMVAIWIDFLLDIHWLEKKEGESLVITPLGVSGLAKNK